MLGQKLLLVQFFVLKRRLADFWSEKKGLLFEDFFSDIDIVVCRGEKREVYLEEADYRNF